MDTGVAQRRLATKEGESFYRASVLVAAYRRPEHLARVLAGLERQSLRAFETIVCEDGMDPEVAAVTQRYCERLPGGLSHLLHEDTGFRKCRILNEGIRHARSPYLIFLDGDCVPHRDFVAAHLRHRRSGRFLVGRRVMLGPELSAEIDEDDVRAGRLDRFFRFVLWEWLRGRLRHAEAGLRLPGPLARWIGPVRMKGCNFSCWRDDLITIDGFDERFESPGVGEDSDVRRRLELLGLRPLPVRHAAICYHLDHPRAVRTRAQVPDWYREEVALKRWRCPAGLVHERVDQCRSRWRTEEPVRSGAT